MMYEGVALPIYCILPVYKCIVQQQSSSPADCLAATEDTHTDKLDGYRKKEEGGVTVIALYFIFLSFNKMPMNISTFCLFLLYLKNPLFIGNFTYKQTIMVINVEVAKERDKFGKYILPLIHFKLYNLIWFFKRI